jgi:hypothetical protein
MNLGKGLAKNVGIQAVIRPPTKAVLARKGTFTEGGLCRGGFEKKSGG